MLQELALEALLVVLLVVELVVGKLEQLHRTLSSLQCHVSAMLLQSSLHRRHGVSHHHHDESSYRMPERQRVLLRRQQESASNWYCPNHLPTRHQIGFVQQDSLHVDLHMLPCTSSAFLREVVLSLLSQHRLWLLLMMFQVLRFLLSSDRCVRSTFHRPSLQEQGAPRECPT